MILGKKFWRWMWVAAAAFNFLIGIFIVFLTEWSFRLSYSPSGDAENAMALRLWRDFGIFVLMIGVGYYLVSRNLSKNQGVVILGIGAKSFDVITLSVRYAVGLANPIVLVPAIIDGLFMLLFIVFLKRARSTSSHMNHAG